MPVWHLQPCLLGVPHDWGHKKVLDILEVCFPAVSSGGMLGDFERWLIFDSDSFVLGYLFSLHVWLNYGGDEV